MKFTNFLSKITKNYDNRIAIGLIIFFSLIYSFMSVRIHNQFQTFGGDLGIFDQGIWMWSQFKFPFSTFEDVWWLGDHFHLALLLIVPFYWIYSNVRTLLVIQAVLCSLGGLPLYFLSKRITKNSFFSLVTLLGYLLFYSFQWNIFSGFHEYALFPLFFGSLLLFWETKNKFGYWLSSILLVFVVEEFGFLLAGFGIWQLLRDKKRWKQAVLTILLGSLSSLIIIYFIIPHLAGKDYIHFNYGQSGYSIIDVFKNIIRKPWLLINAFIDSKIKLETLWITFWPWAFLPFFSPLTLILPFEQFSARFLDYNKVVRWTPFFIYSLPMTTLMYWGSIYGYKNLFLRLKKKARKVFSILVPLIIFLLIILEDVVMHAPINSIFKKQFYVDEVWFADNKKIFKCVPPTSSVAAQNNLVPWLSQREKIKALPDGIGYDYIVVDLHEGQSENNFQTLHRTGTIELVNKLVADKEYKIICQENNSKVLKKL